jgi:hypothetical protein
MLVNEYQSEFAVIGGASILYHCSYSYSISVQYAEKTIFGSHGVYYPWTGTEPRNFDISATLVASSPAEATWNLAQTTILYNWTQESPPQCKKMKVGFISDIKVRIESLSVSVDENTLVLDAQNTPIQIGLSLSVKECRSI